MKGAQASFFIVKRNGTSEPYKGEKIERAIEKSFLSTGKVADPDDIRAIVAAVETMLTKEESLREVERIQDMVEQQLMQHGYYAEAKSYILFRNKRTEQRQLMQRMASLMGGDGIEEVLRGISHDFPEPQYALSLLAEKESGMGKSHTDTRHRLHSFMMASSLPLP